MRTSIKLLIYAVIAVVSTSSAFAAAFTDGGSDATTATGFSCEHVIVTGYTKVKFDYPGNSANKITWTDYYDLGTGQPVSTSVESTSDYIVWDRFWNPNTESTGGKAMYITNPGWSWQYYHAYAIVWY